MGYQWNYVIMLPNDVYAHVQMLKEYGERIRWKSKYVLKEEAIFGIQGRKKLFGNHDRESKICLFFDGAGGSAQSIRLIRQIQSEKRKAEWAIANGARAAIGKQLQKYLKIEGEEAARKVVSNYEKWDAAMSEKGYYSMAVSEKISPDEANRLYKLVIRLRLSIVFSNHRRERIQQESIKQKGYTANSHCLSYPV